MAAGWFVKYLDQTTNREVQSLSLDTREQAVALALDRESHGHIIHAVVGPSGEEPWGQATPKQE